MLTRPPYFDRIKTESAGRWKTLESDPILAAPWHQLFQQVQSPRHVVSELLQNADDAGATEAKVELISGHLVFSHNGEDFREEHLASLCRFGYSNKRALHTIGFRGVGFKSTFSLGNPVEVFTPTLAIAFDEKRFTEPTWKGITEFGDEWTHIRVPVRDEHRRRELDKNLDEWRRSPVSLLFFRNIRALTVGDDRLRWISTGNGPVSRSEWMALESDPDEPYLLIRSEAEAFPPEAIKEIRQARLLLDGQAANLPPCRVELVLGAAARLFVVLPTGVLTALPFACNAPFIQDPARLKIKDPETSPTNQWLLERAGELAGTIMLDWLERQALDLDLRARAYELLPDPDIAGVSLEESCAAIVRDAFERAINDKSLLLTEDGSLLRPEQAVIYPSDLFKIWKPKTVTSLFDSKHRPALYGSINLDALSRLKSYGLVSEIEQGDVMEVLQQNRPPQPSHRQLLRLWSYLSNELTSYGFRSVRRALNIVPVRGKDTLHSAEEVVRLSEKRLLQSESDWDFLSKYLLVLNHNWPAYIVEQRRNGSSSDDVWLGEDAESSHSLLNSLGLLQSSDMGDVIEQVAEQFFSETTNIGEAVRLAHIAAKLGAGVGDSFRFVSRDGRLREAPLFIDSDGLLEELFSKDWCDSNVLHPSYTGNFAACTSQEWSVWLASGRSGIAGFPPLLNLRRNIVGKQRLEDELKTLGFHGDPNYRFQTQVFRIDDWDFDPAYWNSWKLVELKDPTIWSKIIKRILDQPRSYWEQCRAAKAYHVATTGNTSLLTQQDLLPSWVFKFRELQCLPDVHGRFHRPDELLRRTPETEPLLEIEPFVSAHLDTEVNRPLLQLLGVASKASGPDRILDRLRSLAGSSVPGYEVDKWYERLDRVMNECATKDATRIIEAFTNEEILLTEGSSWVTASGVFLNADEEDVPGAELVRASVHQLSLWRRIGIAERPTVELALQWLNTLPTGQVLSQGDLRRVENLISRHPVRVWEECERWLNLAGEWTETESLEFALSMQSLVKWGHLHDWVKQKTAVLRGLSFDVAAAPPFSQLEHLSDKLVNQLQQTHFAESPVRKEWLSQIGRELRRVRIGSDGDETARVRELGKRLEQTQWQKAPKLRVIPYIGNTPAGIATEADVIWLDTTLYVKPGPLAKVAMPLSQELGKIFRRPDIVDAIKICLDRPAKFVTEYFEENFDLAPAELLDRQDAVPVESDDPGSDAEPAPEVAALEINSEEEERGSMRDDPEDGPEQTDEDWDIDDEEDEGEVPEGRSKRPPRPSLIARFAEAQGFEPVGDNSYRHADGSTLKKTDEPFHWELRKRNGFLRYYWVKDHCLENAPLQLGADVWTLLDQYPQQYALVLASTSGQPVEVTGSDLHRMSRDRELRLFPATYRITYTPRVRV